MRDIREWILPILFGLIAGTLLYTATEPDPPRPKPQVDINLILKDGRIIDVEIDGERQDIKVTP